MDLKYKIIIAVGLFLLALFMIFIKFDPLPSLKERVTQLAQIKVFQNSTPDYSLIIKPESDLDFISSLAYNNSISHEYILNVYDCTEFSEELVKQLKTAQYSAECSAGYLKNLPHTWTTVYLNNSVYQIESTRGYIIDSEEYKQDYELKWNDRCW